MGAIVHQITKKTITINKKSKLFQKGTILCSNNLRSTISFIGICCYLFIPLLSDCNSLNSYRVSNIYT